MCQEKIHMFSTTAQQQTFLAYVRFCWQSEKVKTWATIFNNFFLFVISGWFSLCYYWNGSYRRGLLFLILDL